MQMTIYKYYNTIYHTHEKTVAHAACAESLDCPSVSSSVRWTSQQVVERGQRAPACRKKGKDQKSEREIDILARLCWKKKTCQ